MTDPKETLLAVQDSMQKLNSEEHSTRTRIVSEGGHSYVVEEPSYQALQVEVATLKSLVRGHEAEHGLDELEIARLREVLAELVNAYNDGDCWHGRAVKACDAARALLTTKGEGSIIVPAPPAYSWLEQNPVWVKENEGKHYAFDSELNEMIAVAPTYLELLPKVADAEASGKILFFDVVRC